MDSSGKIRVFLLDDHEIVRRGLQDLLEAEGDIEVAGEAGTAAEALRRVPAVRPDVAVLDVRLEDGDGITVCRDLLSDLPDLNVLMLTSFSDDEALLGAVLAGAKGYVLKQLRGPQLVDAVRRVAGGESLIDPRTAADLTARLHRPAAGNPLEEIDLTDRERQILALIGQGLSNKQIAAQAFLSEKTVRNYVSILLAKLGLARRSQAAILAEHLRHEHGDNWAE
ncbi:MAG: Protein-glutamate methylesterase [Nocardia sp.]|uniref:response regulator n=1 Tax=Nocardia sp. TaxID=1821 RepID=UPI00262BE8B7|nr:response regulator transcription factor [Nocardia sp.]MCU1644012.1 Protein-glutamate methylesterase [Nocardia sp.]